MRPSPAALSLAERAAKGAGVVTSLAGPALILAPLRTGPPLGLGDDVRRIRAIGVSDVLIAAGLLAGAPRWPWMAARAAANAAVAAHCRGESQKRGATRESTYGAIGMTALTLVDAAAAATLRAGGR